MLSVFLRDLYVFLPAFIANAAPVVAKNIPVLRRWSMPVDPAMFGKNKTVRGLLGGILAAMLTIGVQWLLVPFVPLADPLLFQGFAFAVLGGFLLGFGAIAGDMGESAVKRLLKIAPGRALPVWDGVDYILGALLFLSPVYVPPVASVVFLLIFAPLASLAANVIAYAIGWKDRWY